MTTPVKIQIAAGRCILKTITIPIPNARIGDVGNFRPIPNAQIGSAGNYALLHERSFAKDVVKIGRPGSITSMGDGVKGDSPLKLSDILKLQSPKWSGDQPIRMPSIFEMLSIRASLWTTIKGEAPLKQPELQKLQAAQWSFAMKQFLMHLFSKKQ